MNGIGIGTGLHRHFHRHLPSCISRQHGNAIYKRAGQEPEPWLTGSLNPAENGTAEQRNSSNRRPQQDALFGVEFNFSLTL